MTRLAGANYTMPMNNLTYDSGKHIELLKKQREVLNQGKYFFKEYENEELMIYSTTVSDSIISKNRVIISAEPKYFLNKKINLKNPEKFYGIISGLHYTYRSLNF